MTEKKSMPKICDWRQKESRKDAYRVALKSFLTFIASSLKIPPIAQNKLVVDGKFSEWVLSLLI